MKTLRIDRRELQESVRFYKNTVARLAYALKAERSLLKTEELFKAERMRGSCKVSERSRRRVETANTVKNKVNGSGKRLETELVC